MTPRERKRLEEMSRDCPTCPECKAPCGSTRDAEGYRRWDNLLTCCACGHGWMSSDGDREQARRADDAHDHLETLEELASARRQAAKNGLQVEAHEAAIAELMRERDGMRERLDKLNDPRVAELHAAMVRANG